MALSTGKVNSGIVAKTRVNFSTTGVMTLIGAQNISSLTRNNPGRYTVNFTSPVPVNTVLGRATGRFGDFATTDEQLQIGVSRQTGQGIFTNTANLTIRATYQTAVTFFDPYDSGRPGSWIYIEFLDPTVNL